MLRILLYICFGCITQTICAINGRLYSSELLASSNVTDVCQDSYGFIWIATDYGLSRFDGYHFTNYYNIRRDTTTLPDNYIGCFLADRDGRLWIGHGKGLCRYDYASESFVRLTFPNGIEPRVNTLVQDRDGNIFVGTAGMGMYVMSDGRLRRAGDFSDKTNDHFFAHFHIDKRGSLWSGNHKDMAYLYVIKDGKMLSYKAFHSNKGEPMAFVDIDEKNVLLVCKKGILRYNYETGALADADYDLGVADGDLTLNHAYFGPSGNLYLGTYGHGLLVIGKGEKSARRELLTENNRQETIPYVSRIMRDRNRNLWLACYDTGIFLASQQKSFFDSWSLALQDPQFSGRLTAVAGDDQGGAWCAVRQGMIYHLSHEGRILSRIATQPELRSVCRGDGNSYWLGAGNTLYLMDATTGKIQKKQEFEGTGIGQIISDGCGHLYISVYGKGFYRYDMGSGAMQAFNANMTGPHGKLANNWVSEMMIDSQGLLWLSTATGVSCMNPQNGSFDSQRWHVLLEGISCGPLCETKEHDIIIGTTDGLYIYRRRTNKAERFPDSEALENVSISSIAEDEKGNLWISSLQGLWQYVRHEKHFVNHMLSTREYIEGAFITFPDGRMAFVQRDGLTVFNPSDISNMHMPLGKVHLTRFLRDGKPVDLSSSRFIIPYDENSFSMEFSLLDYKNTDNISFQYRLNEGQWVSAPRGSNVIPFDKMEPGTYIMDVRAETGGTTSSEVLTLTVVVLNPWYLSTWAIIVYLIVAVLVAWYLIRQYSQRKQRELDEDKRQFIANTTEEIRSPLNLIMEAVNTQTSTENIQSTIEVIDANARRIDQYIKDIEVKGNDELLMERIMKCINDNISNSDLDVNLICSEAGISRSHLHRKMKEMTGLTVHDLILNIRMGQAARMLTEQKLNITQVAYAVGYSSQPSFSAAFRRHFGISPTEYINRGER